MVLEKYHEFGFGEFVLFLFFIIYYLPYSMCVYKCMCVILCMLDS